MEGRGRDWHQTGCRMDELNGRTGTSGREPAEGDGRYVQRGTCGPGQEPGRARPARPAGATGPREPEVRPLSARWAPLVAVRDRLPLGPGGVQVVSRWCPRAGGAMGARYAGFRGTAGTPKYFCLCIVVPSTDRDYVDSVLRPSSSSQCLRCIDWPPVLIAMHACHSRIIATRARLIRDPSSSRVSICLWSSD